MKKGLLFVGIITAILGIGCRTSHDISKPRPTIEQIITPAIEMINSCSSDTSFNTMAYRAAYSAKDTSLVVYLGKSLEHNSYKWEIPLKMVDKTNLILFRQDYNVSSITLSIYGGQLNVRYYMDNKPKSKSGQFILYLGKCFSSDDKDNVLLQLTQAITEAQRETLKREH